MDQRLSRRKWLSTAAATSTIALAGCAGSEDDTENGNENGTESESNGDENDDQETIEIAYSISDPVPHDEVPDEVVEHPTPEDYRWAVVGVELVAGTIDAMDLHGLTQIEIAGESHPARAVALGDDYLDAGSDGSDLETGAEATVYYRIPDGTTGGTEWVTEQLENQHGEIDTRRTE